MRTNSIQMTAFSAKIRLKQNKIDPTLTDCNSNLKKTEILSPNITFSGMQRNYEPIWQVATNSFGQPSADFLKYCIIPFLPKKHTSIIDIGSGNGRYAIEFAKQGYKEVTALELTKSGCKLIKKRGKNYPQLVVQQANILNYQPKKQYDIVASSGLVEEFEYKEEQINTIRNMQNLVKKGGRIILRYCLFISDRTKPNRMDANFVKYYFPKDQWKIVAVNTDKAPFKNTKSTVKNDLCSIQRQTFVADKI